MMNNTIQVPEELWLTSFRLGGQTTDVDPPVLIHTGTKSLELTQADGNPLTLKFRVWNSETESEDAE
jgi:hypothetical protein